jgi:hypothetical protein
MTADIRVDRHGSITLLTPLTPNGRRWLSRNVEAEAWQWIGGGLAVEPRYADALVDGAVVDGLEVDR